MGDGRAAQCRRAGRVEVHHKALQRRQLEAQPVVAGQIVGRFEPQLDAPAGGRQGPAQPAGGVHRERVRLRCAQRLAVDPEAEAARLDGGTAVGQFSLQQQTTIRRAPRQSLAPAGVARLGAAHPQHPRCRAGPLRQACIAAVAQPPMLAAGVEQFDGRRLAGRGLGCRQALDPGPAHAPPLQVGARSLGGQLLTRQRHGLFAAHSARLQQGHAGGVGQPDRDLRSGRRLPLRRGQRQQQQGQQGAASAPGGVEVARAGRLGLRRRRRLPEQQMGHRPALQGGAAAVQPAHGGQQQQPRQPGGMGQAQHRAPAR